MKTFFSLFLTLAMTTPAFGQGKVRLINDSLHLVYFSLDVPDPTLRGHAYTLGMSGITLTIELWSGTSSTSLSLEATTDFTGQPIPGAWNGRNVTLPTAAGLTFFQIYIYDIAAGSYIGASTTPGYSFGTSGLFTAVASGTTAYYSLVQQTSPAFSTWANGTHDLSADLFPGAMGAIALGMPEPSTFALSCLGLALLLLRHRVNKGR